MAGASIKKLVDFIWGEPENDSEGYEDEVYDQDYNEEYETDEQESEQDSGWKFNIKKKNKVVSMPQPQQIKMKIAKPTSFDQAREIIAQLKEKNSVVLNLEYVNKDVARRIVDAVGGAVEALDGNIEKVSNSIFVVAPYNYDIVNEVTRERIESKFSTSWIK